MLEGACYAGYITHGENIYEGLHEAIIERSDFEKVAKQRAARDLNRFTKALAKTPSDYILTGMLKCGACGGAYVGARARGPSGVPLLPMRLAAMPR
jgi:hypothetical protein